MEKNINPFHELYVTESIGPDAYVKLFSDVLMKHTLPLFKPGNVILKGLPGTGKSMMLNLLKPSIRIAYKNSGIPFPVPDKFKKFIGAGINLIRSSISDFGQRPVNSNNNSDLNELAIYFGDFLNYWVIRDILNSIKELGKELSDEIGINLNPDNLEHFIKSLKNDECWFGYLSDVTSLNDLDATLRNRITTYRSYLNYNIDSIPSNINNSKTAIGIPIAVTANCLRKSGIIDENVQIFIRIDQYEELAWLDESINGLGSKYESVIHKLLAMRDASVSYRIGTRPFAWTEERQSIFGTSARLEPLRNYIPISIDEVLRRPENQKTYLFPHFAEDIFTKRLKESGYLVGKNTNDTLKDVFGTGLKASEKARRYVANSKENSIELDGKWPEPWKIFLKELANSDPFSARLAEAWARQKGKEDIVNHIPNTKPFPWEEKKYWLKERTEQALIQIASRNRQQLIWEGKDDILNLSGGNILAFLSLCQQIWEVWMRDIKNIDWNTSLPNINHVIQTLGVLESSVKWFENISNEKRGRERKKFISFIGTYFYKSLTEDIKMSYPGHNGFSTVIEELESNIEINKFLKEASDYGDLYDRPHTTKSNDKRKRIKWYLNPILSPYFKLPAIHTKEPYYISINELSTWLVKSGALENLLFESKDSSSSKAKKKHINNSEQGTLF